MLQPLPRDAPAEPEPAGSPRIRSLTGDTGPAPGEKLPAWLSSVRPIRYSYTERAAALPEATASISRRVPCARSPATNTPGAVVASVFGSTFGQPGRNWTTSAPPSARKPNCGDWPTASITESHSIVICCASSYSGANFRFSSYTRRHLRKTDSSDLPGFARARSKSAPSR